MPTFTTSDSALIRYDDQGAGRPVVLVPGILGTSRWWGHQQPKLAIDHRVISFDLRSVGGSPHVDHGHRVARYACDLAELIEHLDLRDVTLIGWSLGYSMSLAYLDLRGQDRLSQLVLVEGSPKLISNDDWSFGFCDMPTAMTTVSGIPGDNYSAFVEGLVRGMYNDADADPEFATLLADAVATDPDMAARLLWNHLTQDWRDVLPRIGVPTLVLGGTNSQIVSWRASEYTANAIPGARLELFDGAGHAMQREQPEKVTDLLRTFLARQDQRG